MVENTSSFVAAVAIGSLYGYDWLQVFSVTTSHSRDVVHAISCTVHHFRSKQNDFTPTHRKGGGDLFEASRGCLRGRL